MQFSIAKLFAVALAAATAIQAQSAGNGGRRGGRGRGKGRGRGPCFPSAPSSATSAAATGLTTFLTTTVQATTTQTTQRPSTTTSDVVVVEPTDAGSVQQPPPSDPPAPPATTPAPPPPPPTPAPAPAPAPAPDMSDDAKKAFDAHNVARAEVGLPPFKWDAQLAAEAQEWANHLTTINDLQHSGNGQRSGQGENLYWQSHGTTPLINGANAWISEKSQYGGQPIGEGNFGSYGHYTQIVWKSSDAVGIAGAKDDQGGVYVVARYSPAGNVIGQVPY